MPTLFRIIVKERLQAEFFIYKHMKKNIRDFNTLWACNNALRIVNDSSLVRCKCIRNVRKIVIN